MESNPEIIYTVVTTLIGCVAYLFKQVMDQHKEQLKTTKEQSEVKQKLGVLEGKQDGIKMLSEEVLKTVHGAIKDKEIKNPRRDRYE